MARTIGYLRVSTDEQDLQKNKHAILDFANSRRLVPVEWVEEHISGTVDWRKREIGRMIEELEAGDTIITAEISRLARSLKAIIEIIEACKTRDIAVYAVKGNWELNGNIESKVMLYMLGLFAEVERDLISMRTREALAARKKEGVRLGRPKGPGRSRLDPFKPEIVSLLKNGSPKSFVAKRYGVSEPTLYNWISKNQLDVSPRMERMA